MQNNYYGGYYKVGQEKFVSKILAAIKATELKLPMTWHFHDDVFAKVKPTGQISLKELYKERALQLREKYDYLILNYSGGSDSWTILNTFLENNIVENGCWYCISNPNKSSGTLSSLDTK